MLLLDPLLFPFSWLHDEPINKQLNRQKEEEKLIAVMVTFYLFFLFWMWSPGTLSLGPVPGCFALSSQTSQVVQPSGWGAWAQWPQQSLASLCLPLAWSRAVRDLEVCTQLLLPQTKHEQHAVVRVTCLYKPQGPLAVWTSVVLHLQYL